MRHNPRVFRELTDHGLRYQCRCACGAHGGMRDKHRLAAGEREAHLRWVAAPQAQRCQNPGAHGARWWEACQLCTGQEPLFVLEEV